jgi:hypothetical protein
VMMSRVGRDEGLGGPMRYLSTSVRPNSAKKTLAVRMGLMKFNLVCSLMLYDSVSCSSPQTHRCRA